MRQLYTLLWYLLLPVLLLRLWALGGRSPAYRQRLRERLGYGYREPLPKSVWVHAVSVGETLAAAPMIEALLQRYPSIPLLVTTTTPTGSERVKALFGNRVQHVYWPWDVPAAMGRLFNAFNPQLVILLETELWPNLIAEAAVRDVPVVLANGRLSARSHRGYARFRSLMTPMLQQLAALAVQTPEEAERFIDLGAKADKVWVTGNVKFDVELAADVVARAATLRAGIGDRPVWIAASTHPGEDEVILAVHGRVLASHVDALLILVPRHQERFDQVAAQVRAKGFSLARRSLDETVTQKTSVYLGDSMGELLMLYGAADVAFVGGSLVSVGGHNLLEPALWSKPIITGPVLHNFTLIADLLVAAGAQTVVTDAEQLAAEVAALFAAPDQCRQRGRQAEEVVVQHRGALAKLLQMLEQVWPL